MLPWFREIGSSARDFAAIERERKPMRQLSARTRWRAFVTAAFVAANMLAVPPLARAQQVVALVDGQPITALDIAHRAKFMEMSTRKVPTRQEVINNLIDELLELRE